MNTNTNNKIAMVVQRYGLEVNGGAELLMRVLAERLAKIYDVAVLTTCAIDYDTWKNDYPAGEEIINGVRVLRFPVDKPRDCIRFDHIHSRVIGLQGTREEELEWMNEQGPLSTRLINYIKHHKDSYKTFVFMTYLYYSTFHGLPLVGNKSVLIPTAHDEPPIYLSIFKDLFLMPKGIFYNTIAEQNFVESKFHNQHIPSEIGGVGIELPAQIDSSNFKQHYNIQAPYMVYLGRIDESKGCVELFQMIDGYNNQRMAKGLAPLLLILVGKAVIPVPKRSYIRSLGFLSENDKYAAVKESEFLVLPSQFESLSMVVLEAFALDKPVLVNGKCQVLKDHCTISNGGLYYTDYHEFAGCVDFLLEHPQARQQMGINGHAYQEEYYVWDNIIPKLVGLIDR